MNFEAGAYRSKEVEKHCNPALLPPSLLPFSHLTSYLRKNIKVYCVQ